MKRKVMILPILMFVLCSLAGCGANHNEHISDEQISKVSISKSKEFGKVNADFFRIYEDKETLELFESLIAKMVKEEGIVDIATPEFDLEIIYANANKQGYHLWIGEKGQKSIVMNVHDTHTIYTISEEMTNKLIDIVA